MLSLSDFHPTSLLLSKVGKAYVWFTNLLGDVGRGGGSMKFLTLLTVSLVVSEGRMTPGSSW